MSIFQVISILFAFFMMYVVAVHHKKRVFTGFESSLWYTLWILFITFALFPGTLINIVEVFHFSRVFDLLVVMAFMVLSIIVMIMYVKQRQGEIKLEEIIRSNAISSVLGKKKRKAKR